MTKPTTLTFGKFLIKVGDGADPEVFSAPCGLTTKSFNQTASSQETVVPSCDQPDAPAYVERAIDALSAEISGSGVLAAESIDVWRDFFESGESKNCRVYLDVPLADNGGYWQGAFVLTQFNVGAERGKKVSVEVTLQSDGEYTWTDAAA